MATVTNEELAEKLIAMQEDISRLLKAVEQIGVHLAKNNTSDDEFYDAEGGE